MDAEREIVILYRALVPLDIGKGRKIDKGDVFLSSRISPAAREKLDQMQRIARVSTPPLGALPDWEVRAKDLAKKMKITTVEDLLNSDQDMIAEIMAVPVSRVVSWKTEVLTHFVIARDGDGGCVARRNLYK